MICWQLIFSTEKKNRNIIFIFAKAKCKKMISEIIDTAKIETLRNMIEDSNNVVLICHKSPDGDAVGATMGLREVLFRLGKNANVVVPNMPAANLLFLPNANLLQAYEEGDKDAIAEQIRNADMIMCMDFNDLARLQGLQQLVEESGAKRVLIDHHLNPSGFCDLSFSFPELSSTCELTYRLLRALGLSGRIGKVTASYLYMGLVTDTGNFAYNSSNPETFEIAAELLRAGAEKDRIYARAFNQQKDNSIRLQACALAHNMKVKRDYGVALVTLSHEILHRYYYTNGDTEGLVNQPLKIPEVFWSVFMREDEGCVKVSMRSVGDFSVRDLCERYFDGGGHKNAAAGEFHGSLEDAVGVYYAMLLKEKNNILEHKEIYFKER